MKASACSINGRLNQSRHTMSRGALLNTISGCMNLKAAYILHYIIKDLPRTPLAAVTPCFPHNLSSQYLYDSGLASSNRRLLAPLISAATRQTSISVGKKKAKKQRPQETAPSTELLLHQYFEGVYGARWPGLWQAMQQPTRHAALFNPFAKGAKQEQWHQVCPSLPLYLESQRARGQPPTQATIDPSTGLHTQYFMDLASGFPPLALAPPPGSRVLDLCAAPGGKTLLLASQLWSSSSGSNKQRAASHLIANDRSPVRRARLLSALKNYLPSRVLQQAEVTCREGQRWLPNQEASFDYVLLDAPCSSERHLAQRCSPSPAAGSVTYGASISAATDVSSSSSSSSSNTCMSVSGKPKDGDSDTSKYECSTSNVTSSNSSGSGGDSNLDATVQHAATAGGSSHSTGARYVLQREDWSPSRTGRNAVQQLSLLMAAMRLLKPGGKLVYSTCSISPTENDQVVLKALKKLQKQGVIARAVPFSTYAGGTCQSEGAVRKQEGEEEDSGSSRPDTATAPLESSNVGFRASSAHLPGSEIEVGPSTTGMLGIDVSSDCVLKTDARSLSASWAALHKLMPGMESTECGMLVLPDRCEGWGPMYWAVLVRE